MSGAQDGAAPMTRSSREGCAAQMTPRPRYPRRPRVPGAHLLRGRVHISQRRQHDRSRYDSIDADPRCLMYRRLRAAARFVVETAGWNSDGLALRLAIIATASL